MTAARAEARGMRAVFARGCVCVRVCGGARVSPWGQGGWAEATPRSAWVRVGVCLQLCVSGQRCLACVWRTDAPTRVCWG